MQFFADVFKVPQHEYLALNIMHTLKITFEKKIMSNKIQGSYIFFRVKFKLFLSTFKVFFQAFPAHPPLPPKKNACFSHRLSKIMWKLKQIILGELKHLCSPFVKTEKNALHKNTAKGNCRLIYIVYKLTMHVSLKN